MKKITIYIFLPLLTISLLMGCVEDDLTTYDRKDSVYFLSSLDKEVFGSVTDSLFYGFGLTKADFTDSIIHIKVAVQGNVKAFDRSVNLQVGGRTTAQENVDFEILETPMIKSGEFLADIPVKLLKSEAVVADTVFLELELLPNEDFDTNMKKQVSNTGEVEHSHVNLGIYFSGAVTEPQGWFVPYLGTFSLKKLQLMADVLEIDPYTFTLPLGSMYSLSELKYFGVYMQRYLDLQKAEGNTVLEEDGTEMEMGHLI